MIFFLLLVSSGYLLAVPLLGHTYDSCETNLLLPRFYEGEKIFKYLQFSGSFVYYSAFNLV